jgi:hypothetical protein
MLLESQLPQKRKRSQDGLSFVSAAIVFGEVIWGRLQAYRVPVELNRKLFFRDVYDCDSSSADRFGNAVVGCLLYSSVIRCQVVEIKSNVEKGERTRAKALAHGHPI